MSGQDSGQRYPQYPAGPRPGYGPESSTSGQSYPQMSNGLGQNPQWPAAPGTQYYDAWGRPLQFLARADNFTSRTMSNPVNTPATQWASGFSQIQDYGLPPQRNNSTLMQYGTVTGSTPQRQTTQSSQKSSDNAGPAQPAWTFDTVRVYRLDKETLHNWLKARFGNANFKIQVLQDYYRFAVPRKLDKAECREIAALRKKS